MYEVCVNNQVVAILSWIHGGVHTHSRHALVMSVLPRSSCFARHAMVYQAIAREASWYHHMPSNSEFGQLPFTA